MVWEEHNVNSFKVSVMVCSECSQCAVTFLGGEVREGSRASRVAMRCEVNAGARVRDLMIERDRGVRKR